MYALLPSFPSIQGDVKGMALGLSQAYPYNLSFSAYLNNPENKLMVNEFHSRQKLLVQ